MARLTILLAVVAVTARACADDSNFRSYINRFGGSLSVGDRTEHTATDVGAIVSHGAGHDIAPNNLDFSDFVVTRSTQRYTYVFIASSYEFWRCRRAGRCGSPSRAVRTPRPPTPGPLAR